MANDYAKVHAADLDNYERHRQPSTEKTKVFYQSDAELYKAEQANKQPEMEIV